MTRVMFAGDVHGDMQHVEKLCRVARRQDVDLIIQLGDFGFVWPGNDRLDQIHNVLAQFDQRLWFIDGNHDDHDRLPHDAPGPVELTDRVSYLPRGYRFELDGVRFLCCGGAVSVDKHDTKRRVPHVSWWPNESISHADFLRCTIPDAGPVDVLLTHDAPENETLNEYLYKNAGLVRGPDGKRRPLALKVDEESRKSRRTVTALVEQVRPRLVVHGHHHHRYNDTSTSATVIGLACNKEVGAWLILGLERLDEHLAELRPQEM